MIDFLLYADTYRIITAVLSGLTAVALVAALWVHGRTLYKNHRRWHWLLMAVTVQQLASVYVTASRARSTPANLPESQVDQPLIVLVLSALALTVAAFAVVIDSRKRNHSE